MLLLLHLLLMLPYKMEHAVRHNSSVGTLTHSEVASELS